MIKQLDILAPAKVNLSLSISGKRFDGYHLLSSLVCFADFGDRIYLQKSNVDRFSIRGEYASKLNQENNLVTKTYNLVKQQAVIAKKYIGNTLICLQKNLPISAGIGGGSSDAAATLVGLNKLWNLNLANEIIYQLAGKLGADVPMCVYNILENKNLWVTGIGEKITVLPRFPAFKLLLINNLKAVSTELVFNKYTDEIKTTNRKYTANIIEPTVNDLTNVTNLVAYLRRYGNDLIDIALELEPSIQNVLNLLKNSGALFYSMSGSGASCFGIYSSDIDICSISDKIKRDYPKYFVNSTTFIG
ncbi:4-(cytidine 5'-diphospho)-2-C-methyl-D-erythritol kinase [Bartonella sp. DGB1]|uniref:4-(cytidine 5'-diphospho)-2-C-methyl-D-erythritol kinase n=1 Tax=Bartonella sp. DGB1 TaxID=3239807 RepID=UPI0035249C4D